MRWMSVEFDRRCGTAQSEDCLQLYIPAVSRADDRQFTRTNQTAAAAAAATDGGDIPGGAEVSAWWPVLSKFHGVDGWPTSAIILPGDRLTLPTLYVCFYPSRPGSFC